MLFKGCHSRGLSRNISLTRPSSQCRQIDAFCFENVSFFASESGQRNLFATIPHQQIKLSASVPVRQTCFWNQFEPWLCGSNLGRGCQGFWALRNRDIAMVVPPWGGPLTLDNHGPNYSHTTMAQICSKSSGLADRHRGNEFNLVMWDRGKQISQANFQG